MQSRHLKKLLASSLIMLEAYFNMGGALKEKRMRSEEIEAYAKAISIKPDFAEAYNNMGVTLQYQGKQEAAA